MNTVYVVVAATLIGVSVFLFGNGIQESKQETKKTEEVAKADAEEMAFVPVDNMHHFMEYICEPSFKSLNAMLTKKPADRKAWKAFKNHSLVLAETAALVAERPPVPKDGPLSEAKLKQWKKISFDVYQSGRALYKSAGNYENAKKNFVAMTDNCNKCHNEFANGKHQLNNW